MRLKTAWFWVFSLVVAQNGISQNLQLHYDLARAQPTATLEYFQADQAGAWFTFIDFDFKRQVEHGANGVSAVYWEIARYISLPMKGDWCATLQYNDGLDKGYFFNPVWLGGFQHLFKLGAVELPVDFLLRRELDTGCWTGQLTVVWQQRFKRWEFAGYLDLWNTGRGGFPARRLAFMGEPQAWFYFTENGAVGGEVEISYNFNGAWSRTRAFRPDRLFLLPTLAIKWSF